MKLGWWLLLAISLVFVLLGTGNAAESESPYDLKGTWKLSTEYAVKKLCRQGPVRKGKQEVKTIIEQSGTDFRMILLMEDGACDLFLKGGHKKIILLEPDLITLRQSRF